MSVDFSPESLERGYAFAAKCLAAKLRGIEDEIDTLNGLYHMKDRPDYYPALVFSILQEFREVDGFEPGWDLKELKYKHDFEPGEYGHEATGPLCILCGKAKRHPDHINSRG